MYHPPFGPQVGKTWQWHHNTGPTLDQIRTVIREEIERALNLDELLDEIREIVHDE